MNSFDPLRYSPPLLPAGSSFSCEDVAVVVSFLERASALRQHAADVAAACDSGRAARTDPAWKAASVGTPVPQVLRDAGGKHVQRLVESFSTRDGVLIRTTNTMSGKIVGREKWDEVVSPIVEAVRAEKKRSTGRLDSCWKNHVRACAPALICFITTPSFSPPPASAFYCFLNVAQVLLSLKRLGYFTGALYGINKGWFVKWMKHGGSSSCGVGDKVAWVATSHLLPALVAEAVSCSTSFSLHSSLAGIMGPRKCDVYRYRCAICSVGLRVDVCGDGRSCYYYENGKPLGRGGHKHDTTVEQQGAPS